MRQWDVGPNGDLTNLRCALCDGQPDSHPHLFFECTFSAKVWRYVRVLVDMDNVPPSMHEIILYLKPMGNKRTAKCIFGKLIVADTDYFIWNERNNRTFKNIRRSPEEIRDIIMVTVQLKLITFRFKNLESRMLLDLIRLAVDGQWTHMCLPYASCTSVVKDPLPVDEVVDLPYVELLNEKRTLIRKYPKTFLYLVGLSRSFVETDVRPTLLRDDDEEMGLLDFVRAVDPFKVKVGEGKLAENEVPLVTETEDRVVSPSLQTIRLVDHTIQDELNVNFGKRRKIVVGEDGMREEFISQQDTAKRHFKERAAELDARIADVRRDMDNDLYPHMLTAIAGRRWVVRHGFRLAVHRCAHFVECQSALGNVISMAINKEGLKDSPLPLIMSALTLKDGEGNKDTSPDTPLLPFRCYLILGVLHSICREMPLSDATPTIRCFAERRGLCPPSGAAPGETSGSVPLHDSSLGVADYQVSTLVLSGDGAPAGKPPVAEIHDDLFDTSVLDKPDDA
ncbi:hypothetical protein Tco_1044364 [Tanacetum coccineum]|uniref:Reverse transcriptase zinc-binding domain-containing protein n=1 Tax=Tanacetum coccineum TaxID=301880 RepID=A0ABQ5GQR6_9ASTR